MVVRLARRGGGIQRVKHMHTASHANPPQIDHGPTLPRATAGIPHLLAQARWDEINTGLSSLDSVHGVQARPAGQ